MLIRSITQNAMDKKFSIRQFPSPENPYIAFPPKNLAVLDISRFTFCKVDYYVIARRLSIFDAICYRPCVPFMTNYQFFCRRCDCNEQEIFTKRQASKYHIFSCYYAGKDSFTKRYCTWKSSENVSQSSFYILSSLGHLVNLSGS